MACLSGIFLLSIFLVTLLFFGIFGRACTACQAYGEVLKESGKVLEKEDEKVEKSYDYAIKISFHGLSWGIKGKAEKQVFRPVKYIRNKRWLQETLYGS